MREYWIKCCLQQRKLLSPVVLARISVSSFKHIQCLCGLDLQIKLLKDCIHPFWFCGVCLLVVQMLGIPVQPECVISTAQGGRVDEAPDGRGGGVPLYPLRTNLPPGNRHGEMSKAASFHTGPVTRHESLSAGEDTPPGHHRFHTTQTFFRTRRTEASCICLHSYQTGWAQSHDELTPLWGYLFVCTVLLASICFNAIVTNTLKYSIFHTSTTFPQPKSYNLLPALEYKSRPFKSHQCKLVCLYANILPENIYWSNVLTEFIKIQSKSQRIGSWTTGLLDFMKIKRGLVLLKVCHFQVLIMTRK